MAAVLGASEGEGVPGIIHADLTAACEAYQRESLERATVAMVPRGSAMFAVANRDVWSVASVQDVVKNNFVFCQWTLASEQGRRFTGYYAQHAGACAPALFLIDPLTGELLQQRIRRPLFSATRALWRRRSFTSFPSGEDRPT